MIEAPVGRHSEKPIIFAEMIETMFPTLPRLEMFARGKPRPGWDYWGNEAPHDSKPEAQIDPLEIPAFLLRKPVVAAA